MTDSSVEKAAQLLGLLTNPVRLRLLLAISEQAELSGVDLQEQVGISQSLLSIHLGQLKKYGLISAVSRGGKCSILLMIRP